jgi:hypothetical protein
MSNAVIGRELKKFGLRPARTPQDSKVLSGVVQVQDSSGKGFSYVHFEPPLVEAVGKALPEGVRPDHPAFIKAINWAKGWRVYAHYLNGAAGVLLWETDSTPLWLARIRRT